MGRQLVVGMKAKRAPRESPRIPRGAQGTWRQSSPTLLLTEWDLTLMNPVFLRRKVSSLLRFSISVFPCSPHSVFIWATAIFFSPDLSFFFTEASPAILALQTLIYGKSIHVPWVF